MEMLSEHTLEGWLEGYLLTGRHGFFSTYEAFVHVIDSMFNQHAKWLEKCSRAALARPRLLAQPADHLDGVAAGPQRLHPSGSRVSSTSWPTRARGHAHLPAAGRQLPAVGRAITACAAPTTSTSSSPTSRRTCSISTWMRRSSTAPRASASGTGPAPTRTASRTWSWSAAATWRRWRRWPRPRSCGSIFPT